LTTTQTGHPKPVPSLSPIGGGQGQPLSLPTLRRARNRTGAVLGAMLVAVCSFGIAAWANSVRHRAQVLVIAQVVPAGSTIEAGDLTVAGISAGPQVSAIPASAEASVLGKVATVPLARGSLLERSEVGSGPAIPAGSSVVGLDLKDGTFPAGLPAGAQVEVVATPSQTGSSTGGAVLAENATVLSLAVDPSGAGDLVSVVVPVGEAASVAAAGASGNVSLVMLPGAGPSWRS
jgi:hypothetical protein